MIIPVIAWLILCIVVGVIGSNRKIGFIGAALISILLSPLFGLIITISSKSNSDAEFQEDLLESLTLQKEAIDILLIKLEAISIFDELIKAKNLLDNGVINQDQFDKIKNRLNAVEKVTETKSSHEPLNDLDREKYKAQVERLTEKVKEAASMNLKDSDFLRGAMVTLSINDECGKIIYLYHKINNRSLFDDIKSIKTKRETINYVLEPLIKKGLTKKIPSIV